jgi:hypothetical protein
MMDFNSTHVFSVKKADSSANITAGEIINYRTHNSFCIPEKTTGDQFFMVYEARVA